MADSFLVAPRLRRVLLLNSNLRDFSVTPSVPIRSSHAYSIAARSVRTVRARLRVSLGLGNCVTLHTPMNLIDRHEGVTVVSTTFGPDLSRERIRVTLQNSTDSMILIPKGSVIAHALVHPSHCGILWADFREDLQSDDEVDTDIELFWDHASYN